MKKILIVEDDSDNREELSVLLSCSGYEAQYTDKFDNVVDTIVKSSPDLVLLDIDLPGSDGKEILKDVRKKSKVPVIMVTGSQREADEIFSFGYGADDYVTKPYNPTLLLLRINNIFKRTSVSEDAIEYMGLKINPVRNTVTDPSGKELVLTKNENLILCHLIGKRGSIVSRDELMDHLWNNSEFINDNTLTVNVSRLRGKLESAGVSDAIETRKGLGYVLR
ncbi:MAG: response regulator transcription factor [Saccharofermentans sp.]|nr:response regulator transcription factor [Saccharofermentans sp.]